VWRISPARLRGETRAASIGSWLCMEESPQRHAGELRSDVRFTPIADIGRHLFDVRFVPCVDGSELARTFFTFAALVGAAMCSASHDGFSVKR
jgi:hypothetical protein